MIDPTRPRLRAAIPLCVAMLLAACGSQASNKDASKPPVADATAGATDSGTGSTHASGGDPAQSGPSDTQGSANADVDENTASDGDDWPQVRDIPGGTLTWTVVYTGTGTTQTPEMKEVAQLHRTLHGQAKMFGAMGNPGEAAPATPLDGINQAMQACGDDMACQQKAAMQAMALARRDPAALERGMRGAMAEAQRDTTWGAASCTAVGKADDTSTWSGMTPMGFSTGVGTRTGKDSIDDCSVQVEERDVRPRLVADDNSKTYALFLPPAEIRVVGKLGDRVEKVPRIVLFPALQLEGIRYDRLDRPLTGHATLHMGRGRGLWSEGWDMPLTEQVDWMFTPQAG